MQARGLMTVNVTCVLPSTALLAAWQLMKKLRVRHLPVLGAEGKVAGMISDRDLLLHAQRMASGEVRFPDATVATAMTSDVITVQSSATASQMVSIMLDEAIDALPVVAPDGTLKGLVTSSDLLALLIEPERVSEPVPFVFQLFTEKNEVANAEVA